MNRPGIISCIGMAIFLVACAGPFPVSQSQNSLRTTLTAAAIVKNNGKEATLTRTLKQTNATQVKTPAATKTVVMPTVSIVSMTRVIPTQTPTATSTSQPPLKAHIWEAQQVLVQIETGHSDGCCYETNPPSMVLYANGLFIRAKRTRQSQYEMLGRKLNRQETCAFLNTIDQIGFLDYDHSVYVYPILGAPDTTIIVNAWKEKQVSGTWFDPERSELWKQECPECDPAPVILPALANANKLLRNFDPGGLLPLPVEKLLLWIVPAEKGMELTVTPLPWSVKEITLEDLAAVANVESNYLVVVEDRADIEVLMRTVKNGVYEQDGHIWYVSLRPYWPSETHFGYGSPISTPEPIVPHGTTLSCSPADGVVAMP